MLSQAPLGKHNTLFVPLIFIISIAISTCATKPPKVEPLKVLSTQTFKCIKQHERLRVYGNKPPWTKTHITIGKGDKIIIFASGAVAMSRNDRYRQPYGLLHLKIGKEGTPEPAILLDNQNYLKPFDTGDLMFAVQDWRNPERINYSSYRDNSGSYLVDVFVVSGNQENYLLKDLRLINAHNSEDETLCSHIDSFLEIYRDLFFADVEVVCDPSNADVFIDAFYQGTAPVVIKNLEKHGSYEICVRFEGYPYSCKKFTPKDTSKLSFQLNKEYELVEVKPLTEKLERLVEEKKALEAKLENEAGIKKQLQKSLMERELTLKR